MNIENSLIVLHQESRYQSANINSMSANKKQIKMSIHQLFCVRLSLLFDRPIRYISSLIIFQEHSRLIMQ